MNKNHRMILVFVLAMSSVLSGCGRGQVFGPETLPSVLATKETQPTDLFYMKKIDSHLQNLVADFLSGKDLKLSAQSNGLQITDAQAVLVDIYVNGSVSDASAQYTALGMTVQSTNASMKVVEGYLPVDRVVAVARLDITKAILPVMGLSTNKTP